MSHCCRCFTQYSNWSNFKNSRISFFCCCCPLMPFLLLLVVFFSSSVSARALGRHLCDFISRNCNIFDVHKKKLWSALNRLQLFTNFKSLISRLNTRIRLYNDTRENMLFVILYIFSPYYITTHHHHFSPYLSFLSFSQ